MKQIFFKKILKKVTHMENTVSNYQKGFVCIFIEMLRNYN